jgi:hypothetical protein
MSRRAGLLLAVLAGGAQATTYNVNTFSMSLANDANCGLREAIDALNAGTAKWGCPAYDGQSATIYLPPGTYTAPVGMDVIRSVNLICNGPGACIVDAGDFVGPMFNVTGNAEPGFSVQRLTFRQPSGNANNVTGVSVETGSANLEDCAVTGFKMNGLVFAGGINSNVSRTAFSNNATEAIFVSPDASVNVSFSTFTGSTGSAIVTGANGRVNSQSNTISNSGQAGVSLSQGSVFTDAGSTLYNNNGAGIDGAGDINLTGTIIRKNKGGGVRMQGGFGELANCVVDSNSTSGSGAGVAILVPSFLNIKYTTISDNKATVNGGGLYMTGGSNLYHCTVSKNTAARGGGFYHNPGGSGGNAYVEVYQGTVAFNTATTSGGGVYAIAGSSPFRTYGCIVAKNTSPSNPDVTGWINSNNTMYTNVTGFTGTHTDDYYPFDPLLGPLMDNAGPNKIKTHALLNGSPAKEKLNNPGLTENKDGRGFPRLGMWDLGAYESGPFETELLTVIGSPTDAHSIHNESGLSNGQGTVLSANALGDNVIYAVAIPEPGAYDIALRIKAGPNRPMVEVATAPGTNVFTTIGTVDMYRSSLAYVTRGAGSFTFTSPGIKYFRLKVTGQNASSTGFTCFYDYIRITKQ